MNSIVYGIGGYDPEHPNGNIIDQVTDNGDGTMTVVRYDDKGTEVEREQVAAPEAPPEPSLDPVVERIEKLEAALIAKGVVTDQEIKVAQRGAQESVIPRG